MPGAAHLARSALNPIIRGHGILGEHSNNGVGSGGLDNSRAENGKSGERHTGAVGERGTVNSDALISMVQLRATFVCEGNKPVSTSSRESCKNPSHELVERRRTFRSSRLSPWQSERGLDPRRAGIDRAEGTCRLHLRGSCPLGGGESGGALSAFPRPRRTVDRCGTAWLRSVRSYA